MTCVFASPAEGRQKFTCTVHELLPGLLEQWDEDKTVFTPWCCVRLPLLLGDSCLPAQRNEVRKAQSSVCCI